MCYSIGRCRLVEQGNCIGPDGASALAEALKANTCLTRLYIDGAGIKARGACAVASALVVNSVLRRDKHYIFCRIHGLKRCFIGSSGIVLGVRSLRFFRWCVSILNPVSDSSCCSRSTIVPLARKLRVSSLRLGFVTT